MSLTKCRQTRCYTTVEFPSNRSSTVQAYETRSLLCRCSRCWSSWTSGTSMTWRKPLTLLYSIVLLSHCCSMVCCSADDSSVVDRDQNSSSSSSLFTRCYCNMPACVSTGYMCKSTAGACFAQLSLNGVGAGLAHVLYACAEQLPVDIDRQACLLTAVDAGRIALRRRGLSSASASALSTDNEVEQWAETVCCATDMCNYYYFRSNGNVDVPDVNNNVDREERKRLPLEMSPAAKTTPSPSSMTTPTMTMIVIAMSLGVALIFAVGVTVVLLRMRTVERFRRRRTIWPPRPLLSATVTSTSLIEPLFKPSTAASHETVNYVQLLREHHPSCRPHSRCRRICISTRDTCHCHHYGIETCSGAGCGCGIASCHNLRLSPAGVGSGSEGVSTSFGSVASDHRIPSRLSTSGGNNHTRHSGDGGNSARRCNSSGGEEPRPAVDSLPLRVDQTDNVAVLLTDETLKSDLLVGNEL